MFDWNAWHEPYTDPHSGLSERLRVVQGHVREFLDGRPGQQTRVVSICAGDGRDLIDVLQTHPDRSCVIARLVELDVQLARRAQSRVQGSGLSRVEVVCADAGTTDVYRGAVPADLVLVCGVLGNISTEDVRRVVATLPQICAHRGIVIWTRHRRAFDQDLTAEIGGWFSQHGFVEKHFTSPAPDAWAVGVHQYRNASQPLESGLRLFTFLR